MDRYGQNFGRQISRVARQLFRQVHVKFPVPDLGSTALTREMRLFIAVEGGDTEEERQLMTGKLQQKMQRTSEHLFLSFTLLLLAAEADGAKSTSTIGILLRNLTDLEASFPYMLAILPSPHSYGRLPKLDLPAPVPPAPVPVDSPLGTRPELNQAVKQGEYDSSRTASADSTAAPPRVEEECADVKSAGETGGGQSNPDESLSQAGERSQWKVVRQVTMDKVEEEAEPRSVFAQKSSMAQRLRAALERMATDKADESALEDELLKLDDSEDPGSISLVTKILSLRKSPLLGKIPTADIRALAHSSVLKKLEPGVDLIRVGTISPSIFTVVNGELSVLIAQDKIKVATIKSGGMVGEMSMLTGEPAGATCRATENGCAVLEITKDSMMVIVRERPVLRQHLDDFVAGRLAENAARLEQAAESQARAQEEQLQKDDGNNLFELHPWVAQYRNPRLKPRTGFLPASSYELHMAYGLLLRDPGWTKRAFVLNRFPIPKKRFDVSSESLHKGENIDESMYDSEALEKAGLALQQSCLKQKHFSVQEYHEPEQSVNLFIDFLSRNMVHDYAGPLLHNPLWRIELMNRQVLAHHLSGQIFGFSDIFESLYQSIAPQSRYQRYAGRMVLVRGPPCSGKTSLLCQAIQRFGEESHVEARSRREVVFMRKSLEGIKHWSIDEDQEGEKTLQRSDIYVSVNFVAHFALNTNTFYDLMFTLGLELQAAGLARKEVLATDLNELKIQMQEWLSRASKRAHVVWIIDGADNLKIEREDWAWLQSVSEGEGSLIIVISHQTETVPQRLIQFCDPIIDLELKGATVANSIKAVSAMYLSGKNMESLCEPVLSLLNKKLDQGTSSNAEQNHKDLSSRGTGTSLNSTTQVSANSQSSPTPNAQSQAMRITPGCLRLVLEWSLFRASDFVTASTQIHKSLNSNDENAVQQSFLADIDTRYRSYGDCLRFLAIARPGLMEYEITALLKVRNQNSLMDSSRFSRFRTEMLQRRIIIVIGGVIDFASAGLRAAAHNLFYDNKQRHLYIKAMLEWLTSGSRRSPRKMVLLGQLCSDMLHFSELPWIPDTNPKSQLLLFQTMGGGQNQQKVKLWGDSVDWLKKLIDHLSDPAVIAMSGASVWTTRQYVYFMSCAQRLEQAANKKALGARNKYRENEEEDWQDFQVRRVSAIFDASFSTFLQNGIKEFYRDLFPVDDGPDVTESRPDTTSILRSGTRRTLVRSGSRSSMQEDGGQESDKILDMMTMTNMEQHAFLLDCAATAMLMLSQRKRAVGALDLVNMATIRIYNILHVSLLDAFQSPCHGWSSIGKWECKWIAFAAFVCVERWQEHQKIIREWALEARTICSERLRLTSTPAFDTDAASPESSPDFEGNFVHNSMAMDEGTRLQNRKDAILAEAETIIDLACVIHAKLEVLCRKVTEMEKIKNRHTQSKTKNDVELCTDWDFDCDAKFEDLHLRATIFWERFDPSKQLAAIRSALDEMKILEETFNMERPFDGMTTKQRERKYISYQKALVIWTRGLVSRNFIAWKQKVQAAASKIRGVSRSGNK